MVLGLTLHHLKNKTKIGRTDRKRQSKTNAQITTGPLRKSYIHTQRFHFEWATAFFLNRSFKDGKKSLNVFSIRTPIYIHLATSKVPTFIKVNIPNILGRNLFHRLYCSPVWIRIEYVWHFQILKSIYSFFLQDTLTEK